MEQLQNGFESVGRGLLGGKALPDKGPATPGRAGGQAGLRFLLGCKAQGNKVGGETSSCRCPGDRRVAFVSALEVAEGWGAPSKQDFWGCLVLDESRYSGLESCRGQPNPSVPSTLPLQPDCSCFSRW